MKTNQGVIYLLTFSILTGFGGYFAKQTIGINPQQILFFRAVLACIFIFAVAIFTKKLSDLKFKLPFHTIFMGVMQGLSIFFFYAALEKTTVTNAVLLTYTAPIFSALFASLFLKEKIVKQTIFGIIFSLIGVIVITNPSSFIFGSDHMFGSLFALLGGFFYGAMAISSKSLTEKTKPIYAAFWQYFVIMILSTFSVVGISPQLFVINSIPLLYLGWAAGGFAFLLYMKGITLVKGQNIQVITMFEVVVASLSGILLLGEQLTLSIVIGAFFILGSVLIVGKKDFSDKKIT